MQSIGIVRKVDDLGRIVIPKEIREQFGISEKDALEIFINPSDSSLLLKKYSPGCIFCGELDNLKSFRSKSICKSCLNAAKKV